VDGAAERLVGPERRDGELHLVGRRLIDLDRAAERLVAAELFGVIRGGPLYHRELTLEP
jgi:hypothetical protein